MHLLARDEEYDEPRPATTCISVALRIIMIGDIRDRSSSDFHDDLNLIGINVEVCNEASSFGIS